MNFRVYAFITDKKSPIEYVESATAIFVFIAFFANTV